LSGKVSVNLRKEKKIEHTMLGAIIGDIVGSTRERHNIKTTEFELLPAGSRFTDDTVMTLAVAEWLMTDSEHRPETLVQCMQRLGRKYPNAGYGKLFRQWLNSDDPQPYGSYGNGSAMRVSPIGLYAQSLDEALELARISASVTHNHPEGIKGAQAIAGCVYIMGHHGSRARIKEFLEKIGYDINLNLDEIRKDYRFDSSCQGSVPIAIKAFQDKPLDVEGALRLAISMGGDSDTIAAMTTSIACTTNSYKSNYGLSEELIKGCRALLPADLLSINDRFIAFISRPIYQSYRVEGCIYAGEYPGDKDEETAKKKIQQMVHFGIRHFVDLTEEGELRPYQHLLPEGVTYLRYPIRDCDVPKSMGAVNRLMNKIEDFAKMDGLTYIHCWGGVGRTGTIVGCLNARRNPLNNAVGAVKYLRKQFSQMPKSVHRHVPDTQAQEQFIKDFAEYLKANKENSASRIKDSIRGCLMAGAAGDALGYPVEFMSRIAILNRYGSRGITQFDLDHSRKALVSDDTQMTLFTANGLLMGVTRGAMRGIAGSLDGYTRYAYEDWYYTQTGQKAEDNWKDWHYTWLRDLPELAHRRAPGITCMNACEAILNHQKVNNNSKGCGGIMRVAPIALLAAGYASRNQYFDTIPGIDMTGAEIARNTHLHPLGFLPAAMLTHLLYHLVPLTAEEIRNDIEGLTLDTLYSLDTIYKGKFDEEKKHLARLTRQAVELAKNGIPDADNIRRLGEGWVGEEAWAIALYCAVRHVDNMEEAIIASVNHDGDSDSTGAICGNIMGAIYGYETIKQQRLFCPDGCEFESTLELANIILALADDLYISCCISEYSPIDTPELKQWYARYCEMKPVGI
jgi:ADP-ribosylglycohydrolase/protein-tyrosine phosphatase